MGRGAGFGEKVENAFTVRLNRDDFAFIHGVSVSTGLRPSAVVRALIAAARRGGMGPDHVGLIAKYLREEGN